VQPYAGVITQDTPLWFGLQPLRGELTITSAFNKLPSAIDLTTPLDGVPPAKQIKSMLQQRVGPEQGSELKFATSVVTTDASQVYSISRSTNLTGSSLCRLSGRFGHCRCLSVD